MRRPYPIQIQDRIDTMMTVKLLNGIFLRLFSKALRDELTEYKEVGWDVAHEIAKRGSDEVEKKIALVMETETRAIEMFNELGYAVATYEPFPTELTCAPKDGHPTTEGHKKMLEALTPVLERVLKEPGSGIAKTAD